MQRRYLRNGGQRLLWLGSLVLSNIGCGAVSRGQPEDAATLDDARLDARMVPPDAVVVDAATDGATDAPTSVRRCDPRKPFGAPSPGSVDSINSTSRDQGAVLFGELTIFFASDRPDPAIFTATRSSATSPFGQPTKLGDVNLDVGATGPTLTADGLTMYYAVTPVGGKGDIYRSRRGTTSEVFPRGTAVIELNSAVDDLDPHITEDGSTIYFDSARGGTALDLYMAVRKPDGTFNTPVPLTPLNLTDSADGHPVLTRDGLTLYWSSNRVPGGGTPGPTTDIWSATRASTADVFDAPMLVPDLNSSGSESLSWIAPDNCSALLQSTRAPNKGLQDIFEAVRPL
jgi:WD40-like Beta Propeller Repeat